MRLTQHLKQHPELGLCTLAMLLWSLLGAALVLHFAGQQQTQHTEQYGQALAERGAEQAVEPTLAQDMISLQVIVQSLAGQPAVLRANIHDVENRLLVESGSSRAQNGHQKLSFNAPITLDTHIAGYLTVTLQQPPVAQAYRLFLWLWAAALGFCTAGLWLLNRFLQQRSLHTPTPSNDALMAADSEAPDAEQDTHLPPEVIAQAPRHSVVIELVFLNLPMLQQQLSRTGFQERLQQFDQNLKGILALYAGRNQPLRGHRMLLQVTGDSLADTSFYALCICQLALRLSLNGASPTLKLAANVLPDSHSDAPSSLLESYQQPQQIPPEHRAPAVWVAPALQCEQLEKHVLINQDNQLEQIKPPYQSLLQRQEQQLASIPLTSAVLSSEPRPS